MFKVDWRSIISTGAAFKMKTSLLVVSVLLLVMSNVELIMAADAPKDICSLCFCDTGIEPILISCEKSNLTSLFTEEDWTYTLKIKNLDISNSTVTFDVRFDENELETISKFPPLPIVSLSFRGNRLNTIEPYAFEELDSLASLDLSSNQFTAKDLPEPVFEGKLNVTYYKPLSLQNLNMSNNNIHSIEDELFDHFPFLTSLDLSQNPIRVLGGSTSLAIASLHSLEYLNLAYTGISDIPAGMIHSLIDLVSLDLTGNQFTTIPPELKNAHNLTVLILDDNRFESFDADSFTELDGLKELSISYMKSLRLIEARAFGSMKKLVKFNCHHNRNLERISNAAFYEIAENPDEWPIREIRLNDNALSHIDEALAAWKVVQYIDIQNNPFKCNCDLQWMAQELVDQIRRTHPQLVRNIVCGEPENLKGGSIVELGLEPETFSKCKPGGGYGLNGQKYISDEEAEAAYGVHQAAAVTVLVIGVILVVIGLSILGVLVVKRRAIASALIAHQEIRYQRAGDDDFEQHQVSYKSPSSAYRV